MSTPPVKILCKARFLRTNPIPGPAFRTRGLNQRRGSGTGPPPCLRFCCSTTTAPHARALASAPPTACAASLEPSPPPANTPQPAFSPCSSASAAGGQKKQADPVAEIRASPPPTNTPQPAFSPCSSASAAGDAHRRNRRIQSPKLGAVVAEGTGDGARQGEEARPGWRKSRKKNQNVILTCPWYWWVNTPESIGVKSSSKKGEPQKRSCFYY